jgi:hypothetical protein
MEPGNKAFIHPLSSLETIETEDGKKKVINSWAFASMIWTAVLGKNNNAQCISESLFSSIPDGQDKLFSLYSRSQQGDNAAIREAIAILAIAMDEKIGKAFEEKDS